MSVDYLNVNPALEALRLNVKVTDNLENKARNLLQRMDRTSKQFDNVTALAHEFNLQTNFDEQGITYLDFTNTEFQELIDRLYDTGFLNEEHGQRKYKFETKKEIYFFKARLEAIQNQLKNQNQEPLILIQPLLNLIELFNKMATNIIRSDENLKAKTNTR